MTRSVISQQECERIRSCIKDPVQTDREARRIELRQKSQRRTEKWPNTLEALRRKKDNWRKEREESEEARRLEIDANELALQQQARLKQIERANDLLYGQTDKMKTLRSKCLLVDVLKV